MRSSNLKTCEDFFLKTSHFLKTNYFNALLYFMAYTNLKLWWKQSFFKSSPNVNY